MRSAMLRAMLATIPGRVRDQQRAGAADMVSIQWGAWADAGMASRAHKRADLMYSSTCTRKLQVAEGLAALKRVVYHSRCSLMGVVPDIWSQLLDIEDGLPAFLSGVARETTINDELTDQSKQLADLNTQMESLRNTSLEYSLRNMRSITSDNQNFASCKVFIFDLFLNC